MNQRDISLVSSDSLNMVLLCAFSDQIMLMPALIADIVKEKLPLVAIPPPPELEMQFDCYLHYHHSRSKDKYINNVIETVQNYLQNENINY